MEKNGKEILSMPNAHVTLNSAWNSGKKERRVGIGRAAVIKFNKANIKRLEKMLDENAMVWVNGELDFTSEHKFSV